MRKSQSFKFSKTRKTFPSSANCRSCQITLQDAYDMQTVLQTPNSLDFRVHEYSHFIQDDVGGEKKWYIIVSEVVEEFSTLHFWLVYNKLRHADDTGIVDITIHINLTFT